MNTGKIIRSCREGLNWLRPKLAEESGLSVQSIVNTEKRSDCRVSTLVRCLNAMGYEIVIRRKELILDNCRKEGERIMSWYSDGEPFDEHDDPYCEWRAKNGIKCGNSKEECDKCKARRRDG